MCRVHSIVYPVSRHKRPLRCLAGLDLVAFRTEDGVAHVFDAYCPHLGAHLGVMGRVVGDCIECPFHGWRFSGKDGACTHVPYAKKGWSLANTITK